MFCPKCSSPMRETTGRYQYRECGLDNVCLEDWPLFVCGSCHLELPLLPDAEEATRMVTKFLVRQPGRLDGDAILFLRKAMGLKSVELGSVLRVTRATVSRWENNNTSIDGLCDLRLRLEAIDRILPPVARREMVEELVPLFQYQYNGEIPINRKEIVVPREAKKEDDDLVTA